MSNRRKKRPKQSQYPEFFESYLKELAKEAAGKPLSESLKPGTAISQLIGRITELALDAEMSEHLGYEKHERQESGGRRVNTRNGSSKKTLKSSQGAIEVSIPRDRLGEFEPQLVPKKGRLTQEFEQRIVSLYTSGMTTADIAQHVAELYHTDISSMLVSRVVEKLEPELKAWRNRPLQSIYAVVFIDALYINVRHDSRVHSTALYTVCGYGEQGRLEVLGLYLSEEAQNVKESASFWHHVLVELQGRGVEHMLMVCADGLTGLPDAVEAVYPKAQFSPCVVHLVRSSTKRVRHTDRKALCKDLRAIYKAATYEQAELALETLQERWDSRYPALTRLWKGYLPRLAHLFDYTPALRTLVYTTNPIENVHRQFRKVSKNRALFPNVASAKRLFTLVARRVHDKNLAKRVRPDWRNILKSLHIHFGDVLDSEWGWRTLD